MLPAGHRRVVRMCDIPQRAEKRTLPGCITPSVESVPVSVHVGGHCTVGTEGRCLDQHENNAGQRPNVSSHMGAGRM